VIPDQQVAAKAATDVVQGLRKPPRRIRSVHIEIFLAACFFIGLSAAFGFYLRSDLNRQLDTAMMLEVTDSSARYGTPFSQASAAILDARRTWTMQAEAVCKDPLAPGPESYPNGRQDALKQHAYYFGYILAPLTMLFSVNTAVTATQALALTATLLLVYWTLRQEHVNPLGSAVFCALVVAYPVWSLSLSDDFYMDRYFPPLALTFLILLYRLLWKTPRRGGILLLGAIVIGGLAALTNDRSMLYVMGITAGMIMLAGPNRIRNHWKPIAVLLVFCIVLGSALAYYLKVLNVGSVDSIPTVGAGIANFYDNMRNPAPFRFGQSYADLTIKFLFENAVLFGIWGIFSWRFMLLALGAMLPNMVTTLGGAEKIQFSTHYHSQYLPVLLFAVALGFASVWQRWRWRAARSGVCLGAAVLGLGLLTFSPGQPGWKFGWNAQNTGILPVWTFYQQGSRSGVDTHLREANAITAAVPRGVTVTSISAVATALNPDRHWLFYPIGIDTADYAVTFYQKDDTGNPYFGGAVNYTGLGGYFGGAVSYVDQGKLLDLCLTQRLEKDGYNVRNPTIIGSYAVLKRAT